MDSQLTGILFLVSVVMAVALGAAYIYSQVRPGQLKIRIISETRMEQSFYVSIHKTFFVHEKRRYTINADRVYWVGFFRTPIAVYQENVRLPLDLLSPSQIVPMTEITAGDMHDAIESHVARDVLESFREQFLTPEVRLGITVILQLVGFGAIYYFMTQRFDELLRFH